jgi:serine/threonine protein kinase/tetratricopeptide (TPR) repeat protein
MIGSTVSHYTILGKLGEGGMGVVYKARDTRLERLVALKFLPADVATTPSARQRFVNEARAASALNHPNVAVVYDVGESESHSFIAMELVEGESIKELLRSERLTIEQVEALGLQVAEGLQAAHGKGIVHRDIKPENLLLTTEGHVKIMDFGIAKRGTDAGLTQTGTTLGTLSYMSPEQLLADIVDHRSDLWSLGVVLYEMLARELPFRRDREAAVLYEILNREPTPVEVHRPDTPQHLRALIAQLLQKDPDRRPASAADVARQLRTTTSVHAVPAALSVPDKSIAVLYFENMSSERESDYICAGITEDIITDLSKIGELSVVSRTDMLPFRNKEVNIRQVADALRVNYVLEGSVRKAGNRIRVTAQLINARDGYHLWADRFDGLVEDIFDLQNEVARKIADALKVSLTASEEASLAKKPTDDLRAYDLYMRGREFLARRGKKNTEMAMRMFESALDIDRNFAGAYAGLAEASAYMHEWYDGGSHWLGRAIEHNQKALELDPASIEARFGIAMVYYHQRRYGEARRTLLGVLDADARNVPARLRLGIIAERSEDFAEAMAQYQAAAEIGPHEEEPWRHLASLHRKLGDTDSAQTAAINVIEIISRKLEASLEDVVLLSRLAEAYARFGGKEETHAILRRVLELDPSDGLALYHAACAHALLGETGAALMMLRRAFDSGFRAVAQSASTDSAFATINANPDFRRLVAELL